MTWADADASAFARVDVTLNITERNGVVSIDDPLSTRYEVTRLTESEYARLHAQMASGPQPGPPSRAHYEVVDADGVHEAAAEGGLVSDSATARLLFFARFVVAPDTERIRLVLDEKPFEELVRPAEPPKFEAMVVSETPLRVALRAQGATHLTSFLLSQNRSDSGHGWLGVGSIEPGTHDSPACWIMLPNLPRPAEYDSRQSLELRISNVFNVWTFRYGGTQTTAPESLPKKVH